MKSRYFLPSRVRCPDALSADEKARLEGSILEAVRRGIARAAGETAEVVLSDSELPETVREFFSSGRYHADRRTYAIPSYQESGAPEETPVKRVSAEEDTQQTAGSFGLQELPPPSSGTQENT